MASDDIERKLTTILAIEVVGYGRHMEKDEEATVRALHGRWDIVERCVGGHGGRIFSASGDGRIAEFPSTIEAVRCAVEIQEALEAENKDLPTGSRFNMRIGINLGDVMIEGSDLLGDGVNLAARLEALASPGAICISGKVFEEVRHKLSLDYADLGRRQVKNISQPVQVYEINVDGTPSSHWLKARKGRRRRVLPAWGVAVAAALVGITVLGWWQDRQSRRQGEFVQMAQSDTPSVAVLPFRNMSSDRENEYFSDGISEELLNRLAQIPGLRVAARTSSFAFKAGDQDVRRIGRQLGVGTILEGSVRKSGIRIRITAQLVDVNGGYHLWSETYDRELDDIFAIQDEIALAIVAALEVTLLPEQEIQVASAPTDDFRAFDLYLLGRHHFGRRTRESIERARDYFKQAIGIDPNYAQSYAGLADAYLLLLDSDSTYGDLTVEEMTALAQPAIDKALELDPGLSEAHASLGLLQNMTEKFEEAEKSLRRAIELNPSSAPAHKRLASALSSLDKADESLAFFEKTLKLDPMSLIVNVNVGAMYMFRGRFDEARERFRKTLEIDPNFALGHHHMGMIDWLEGDLAGAAKWFRTAVALDAESAFLKEALGVFYVDLGDTREAERWAGDNRLPLLIATNRYGEALAFAQAELENDPGKPENLIDLARMAALVGDMKLARATYEKARDLPDRKTDPLMDYGKGVFEGAVPVVELALLMRGAGEDEAAAALLDEIWAGYQAFQEERKKMAHPKARGLSGFDHMEASIFAAMGRDGQALAAMRKAVDNGWRRLWFTERYPAFDNLRSNSEFRALMDRIRIKIDRARTGMVDYEFSLSPRDPAEAERSTAGLSPA